MKGSLLLEYNGAAQGWMVLNAQGQQLNPRIVTAEALAYYLRRTGYGRHVENLDALPALGLREIAVQKPV